MNWFSLKNTASCTTFVHGSKKILHNSFWKTWHKISNAPGDVNIVNTSTFKTSNAPGDVDTTILENFVNKCKTKTIFGQQTKEAHQHISFKSSIQQVLKPTVITSLKRIDISYKGKTSRTKGSRQKRPQAWSSQFQLMYFSRKVEIDHFWLYLVRQIIITSR